jgi:ketosteroid isomerase-like protein
VLDNYVKAVENDDIELYGKVVANDPDMVNFGTDASERVVGWDALKKAMQAQFVALPGSRVTVSDVTVNVLSGGRFAWATSLWVFKATVAATGQAMELPARCTWVLEKRGKGWVIVHFHKSVGTTG